MVLVEEEKGSKTFVCVTTNVLVRENGTFCLNTVVLVGDVVYAYSYGPLPPLEVGNKVVFDSMRTTDDTNITLRSHYFCGTFVAIQIQLLDPSCSLLYFK